MLTVTALATRFVCLWQNDLGLVEESMIGGRTPGFGTPGRSPFGQGTPGRRDPDMYNSPFRSPLAGLNFGAFSPLQGGGFSPTKSPGGLGNYSPTSPGYSPTSPGMCQTKIMCETAVSVLLSFNLYSMQKFTLLWFFVVAVLSMCVCMG